MSISDKKNARQDKPDNPNLSEFLETCERQSKAEIT